MLLLRCVPDNKRAFASGVWYVSFKTFGLLPSPVIFGHIMDESCTLWQSICGKRGRCFDYDVTSLSGSIAYFGFGFSGELARSRSPDDVCPLTKENCKIILSFSCTSYRISLNCSYISFCVVLTTLFYFLSWYYCKSGKQSVCIENQGTDVPRETNL